MARKAQTLLVAALATLGAAACSDTLGTSSAASDVAAAFTSTPLGFGSVTSSFTSSGDSTGGGFRPDGGGHGGHHGGRGDHHGPPGGLDFMGGGFGDDFMGGPRGGGHPFDGGGRPGGSPTETCAFAAATGLVTCTDTHHGLSVTKTLAFTTAAGVAQSAPDSLTDKVVSHVQVSGTTTRRDSVTAVVQHTSDRTVTGLAKGSTQRTVNGTSAGTENLSGTSDKGQFTATRVVGDTTKALVIPVADGRPSYPTSGTVIRSMQATVTYSGQAPVASSRREVITYDGSATAKVVITQDGTTRTCSLPLPHGRPTCN